jgi:hypothetical protein
MVHLGGGSDPVLAILGAALVAGLVIAVRRRDATLGLVLLWALVPIGLIVAISFVKPVYLARYVIGVLPALALALVLVAARIGRAGLLIAAIVVGLLGSSAIGWHAVRQKAPWREATAFVLQSSRTSDSIVFYLGGMNRPFEYYLRQAHAEGRSPGLRPVAEAGTRLWLVLDYSRRYGTPPELAALLAEIHASYKQTRGDANFGEIKIRFYERISP